MSKLRGKIFANSHFLEKNRFFLRAKYLKSSDSFCFLGYRLSLEQIEQNQPGFSFSQIGVNKNQLVLPRSTVQKLIQADSNTSITHSFSVGYKTPSLVSDPDELSKNELLFISDPNLDLDSYLDFSIWQYLFNISLSSLKKITTLYHSYKLGRSLSPFFKFPFRNFSSGRPLGSKNKNINLKEDSEPLSDLESRCVHNMKIAVQKNFFPYYLEAATELAKAKNIPLDLPQIKKDFKIAIENYHSSL